jgi:organic radical activating enzyme
LKCNYCDTDFSVESDCREFSAIELAQEVNKYTDVHSISLTGGEPLLSVEFLKEFLKELKVKSQAPSPLEGREEGDKSKPKIYLETNATLTDKFLQIKPYIDIVSADIKLESATGLDTFELHDKFFEACRGVETFAKIVFNQNITDKEIKKCCELGQKYGIELILQPETLNSGKLKAESGKLNDFQLSTFNFQLGTVLDKFLQNYPNVRLIPQVHKFLNVR